METTIQRNYQLQTNADGSLKLSYRGYRSSLQKRHVFGNLVSALCLFIVGPFIGYLWASVTQSIGGFFVGWIGTFIVALIIINRKPSVSITVSRDGIATAYGDKVAWKDIDETGYMNESLHTGSSSHFMSWVYADVFGKKVNISGYVNDEALANSILNEIRSHRK